MSRSFLETDFPAEIIHHNDVHRLYTTDKLPSAICKWNINSRRAPRLQYAASFSKNQMLVRAMLQGFLIYLLFYITQC